MMALRVDGGDLLDGRVVGLGEDGVARGILESHGLRKSYGKGGGKG